jgi:hypothetical protein
LQPPHFTDPKLSIATTGGNRRLTEESVHAWRHWGFAVWVFPRRARPHVQTLLMQTEHELQTREQIFVLKTAIFCKVSGYNQPL